MSFAASPGVDPAEFCLLQRSLTETLPDTLQPHRSARAAQALRGPVRLVDRGGSSFGDATNVRVITPFAEVEHGFVAAALAAFAEHLPLLLSPDDFWLLVVQGVAAHVEANAEALRQRFVPGTASGSKMTLNVSRDSFVLAEDAANDWAGVAAEFADQIAANTAPGAAAKFAPNFTTTGFTERVAGQVVLMAAMQKYFEYKVMTACAFPNITLLGEPADWRALHARSLELVRASCLPEFAESWGATLDSVLSRVADSAELAAAGETDRIDANFWQSMVKRGGEWGSGGYEWVNGWVNAFLPYDASGSELNRYCEPYAPSDVVSEHSGASDAKYCMRSEEPGADVRELPTGVAKAPVTWDYYGTPLKLHFAAGFLGAVQDAVASGGAVRPLRGWAVVRSFPPSVDAGDCETLFDLAETMRPGSEPIQLADGTMLQRQEAYVRALECDRGATSEIVVAAARAFDPRYGAPSEPDTPVTLGDGTTLRSPVDVLQWVLDVTGTAKAEAIVADMLHSYPATVRPRGLPTGAPGLNAAVLRAWIASVRRDLRDSDAVAKAVSAHLRVEGASAHTPVTVYRVVVGDEGTSADSEPAMVQAQSWTLADLAAHAVAIEPSTSNVMALARVLPKDASPAVQERDPPLAVAVDLRGAGGPSFVATSAAALMIETVLNTPLVCNARGHMQYECHRLLEAAASALAAINASYTDTAGQTWDATKLRIELKRRRVVAEAECPSEYNLAHLAWAMRNDTVVTLPTEDGEATPFTRVEVFAYAALMTPADDPCPIGLYGVARLLPRGDTVRVRSVPVACSDWRRDKLRGGLDGTLLTAVDARALYETECPVDRRRMFPTT